MFSVQWAPDDDQISQVFNDYAIKYSKAKQEVWHSNMLSSQFVVKIKEIVDCGFNMVLKTDCLFQRYVSIYLQDFKICVVRVQDNSLAEALNRVYSCYLSYRENHRLYIQAPTDNFADSTLSCHLDYLLQWHQAQVVISKLDNGNKSISIASMTSAQIEKIEIIFNDFKF